MYLKVKMKPQGLVYLSIMVCTSESRCTRPQGQNVHLRVQVNTLEYSVPQGHSVELWVWMCVRVVLQGQIVA